MLIDSTHKKWLVFTLFVFGASTAFYAIYAMDVLPYPFNAPVGANGNTITGLAFGIIGSILMIFAGLLGARRKARRGGWGTMAGWLKGHLWLGLLSYPLIIYHAGFQLGGTLTLTLMVLFTLVILSGIFGIIVQQFIPRLMTTRLPAEATYEQIDSILGSLQDEADDQVKKACGGTLDVEATGKGPDGSDTLRKFYVETVQPFLHGRRGGAAGALSSGGQRVAMFERERVMLPDKKLRDTLNSLESMCDERTLLLLQRRLHRWLHGWLLIHIPISAALLILSIAHVIAAIYYSDVGGPFINPIPPVGGAQ